MITVDFNRLSIKPGDRILDIGCGSGRHTCAASRFENVVTIGADLRFDNAVETKKKLLYHEEVGEQGGGPWGTNVADVTSLPFRDDFFDLVICSEVLEHIPGHEVAANEIVRVLRPGKDLVVSVPRQMPERICWSLSKEYHAAGDGHVRIYTKKELTSLLEGAGVKRWAVDYAHGLHSPYWWLKCLVGPARDDSRLVNLYHDFLVWDMMKQPKITRVLDGLLNPLIGKSLVLYLRKENNR